MLSLCCPLYKNPRLTRFNRTSLFVAVFLRNTSICISSRLPPKLYTVNGANSDWPGRISLPCGTFLYLSRYSTCFLPVFVFFASVEQQPHREIARSLLSNAPLPADRYEEDYVELETGCPICAGWFLAKPNYSLDEIKLVAIGCPDCGFVSDDEDICRIFCTNELKSKDRTVIKENINQWYEAVQEADRLSMRLSSAEELKAHEKTLEDLEFLFDDFDKKSDRTEKYDILDDDWLFE